MKKYKDGKYIIDIKHDEKYEKEEYEKQKAYLAHRRFSQSEVLKMIVKAQVNTLDIEDQVSIRMLEYYPSFDEIIGQTVILGFKFTYNGKLYKTRQEGLTISECNAPGIETASLYETINEEHIGNKYDPVPYDGNMALEKDKYYTQYGVLYKCINGSGQAVYNDLKDLAAFVIAV